MQINPCVNFPGACRQALQFYKAHRDGRAAMFRDRFGVYWMLLANAA